MNEIDAHKLAFAEKALERGELFVTFDSRVTGVGVPGSMIGDPAAVLKFSYKFGPDWPLRLDAYGIGQLHDFRGRGEGLVTCFVPWAAVFGASSAALDTSLEWPRPEISAPTPQLAPTGTHSNRADDFGPKPGRLHRSGFRVIDGGWYDTLRMEFRPRPGAVE